MRRCEQLCDIRDAASDHGHGGNNHDGRPDNQTTAPPTPEEAYVAAMRAELPDYTRTFYPTEYYLQSFIDEGRKVCDDGVNGDTLWGGRPNSPEVMLAYFWGIVGEPSDSSRKARIAVRTLCPEVQPLIDALDAGNAPEDPRVADAARAATGRQGSFRVGTEIEPGKWVATDVTGCYWERLDEAGEIIDNNFVNAAPQVIMQIQASDYAVNIEGCTFYPG